MKTSASGQHAIIGALVADAAAMGLHWLYDQPHISNLAPDAPEFRPPLASDYDGVAGYFAHAKKRTGDLSQYGEQLMVMLRCLADNHGNYEQARYQAGFCDHFGYGGSYVGYIDRATRDTLNNVVRKESEAVERALELPFDGSDELARKLANKVMLAAKHFSGDELRAQVEQAVRALDKANAGSGPGTDAKVKHAVKMSDEWGAVSGYPGADDRQLPATAKLPSLIACYAGSASLHTVTESAIRVTSNNNIAVAFGLAATDMMEAAILTGSTKQSVQAGCKSKDADVCKLLNEALAMGDKSSVDATRHFGMACDLDFALPSVAHNIATAVSYQQAIRQNIYAGGDSCGRSIILGAIMGACYGVGGSKGIPEAWLGKVAVMDEARALIDTLS